MADEKSLTSLISIDEIEQELGVSEPQIREHWQKVAEVNTALRDVYNSGKLREAVKQMNRPIILLNFSDTNAKTYSRQKLLELRPKEYMVVHTGLGDINKEAIIPVSLNEGILLYGACPTGLASEICASEVFNIETTAREIRQTLAKFISVDFY